MLLERGDEIVGVESKCTEYLGAKTAKVADAYNRLAEAGDERASSRWFGALEQVPQFRLLDAYQLVKHFLGLRHTYPERPLALVYLYWEPANANAMSSSPFTARRSTASPRSSRTTRPAASSRSPTASTGQSWTRALTEPAWLDEHLAGLRRRYEVKI